MIMKNKIRIFVILICFALAFLTGCSESKKKTLVQNNSKSKNESTVSNNVGTKTQNTKKEIDLLSYIGKSKADIKKNFGNPNKIGGAQSGELYDYNTFYFAVDNNKVVSIGVKCADNTVNGIGIGMMPKDVKIKIGKPTKELNSNGFIMEYRLNNNTISIQYYCNDFQSPVNSITISDLTYGKEKPMEVTKERVESLIEGNWVLEKDMYNENLSRYMHTFSNGIQDKHLGIWSKKYSITSNNTIVFNTEAVDEDVKYYIEFYGDGNRMEIYTLDQYGDRQFEYIYYRYN